VNGPLSHKKSVPPVLPWKKSCQEGDSVETFACGISIPRGRRKRQQYDKQKKPGNQVTQPGHGLDNRHHDRD